MKEPTTNKSKLGETAARVAADFVVVHTAALASLTLVALRLSDTPDMTVAEGLGQLRSYYLGTFVPLSAIFPAVNALNGLYTTLRRYSLEHKLRRAALSSATGVLLFLFLNFLLTRAETLPRTSAIVLSLLVVAGTVGIRWMKSLMMDDEPRTPGPSSEIRGDRVLVVGGAGYIGAVLVRKLLDRGVKVRLLDSLVYGDGAIREVLGHPNLEFCQGDCRNILDLVKAMKGVRDVVHLAALVGDPACEQDRQSALEINYAATRMMVEIAKGHGVEKFIFASSCSVYGASDYVMDELCETVPVSLYGETKVSSEKVLLDAKSESFHPVVLRFSTVFGLAPRPRFDLVVNLLTAKALQEGVITIYNGEQWRPFIHVSDVADAVVLSLSAPVQVVSGEIFNVGDSRLNYRLSSLAGMISAMVPNTVVESVDNSDRRNYRVSFDKIRDRLGFQCARTMEDGIAEIKDALVKGDISDYRAALYSNVQFLRGVGVLPTNNEVSSRAIAALADQRVVSRA